MVRLDTETKLITHAVRMAAFNTEVMLARALHGHYSRAADEAAALVREALHASGDIIPSHGVLTVRLSGSTRCPRPGAPAPWPPSVSSSTRPASATPAPA